MFPMHWGPGMTRSRDELKGRKLAPGVIRRAMGFAAPYKGPIGYFLAATIAGSFLGVVPALLFRRLIDHSLATGDRTELTVLALGAVGVAFGIALLSLSARWFSSRVGEGLIYDLRVKLFDHVQRMPLAFFTRSQTGALISRLNNDVIGAQQAVTGTLGNIVSNSISVGSILIVMLALHWKLTLLALAVLPLFLIPSRYLGRTLVGITREQMQLNAQMNTLMTERFNVAGALVAKLFGRPADEKAGFAARAGRVRDIGIRLALFMRVFFVLLGLVAAVGTAVVYYVGGRAVLADPEAFTSGTLVAFALYVTQLYSPLTQLTNARVDLMTAFVSFERVFEILDMPHAIADRPAATPLERPAGRVTFDAVSFRYPTGAQASLASLEEGLPAQHEDSMPTYVLEDVSFEIAPGRTVALVGPSGAGKTTIAMLVPRIYDVTEGAVRVDGHDVRDVTMSSLAAAIGVVTQDPHMYHDTIASNLRFAKPDATEEEMVEAARAAQIYDLIASLPDGFNTVVGERGYRLSGGEKQRLAIARVLLKDPAILILDEATAHLDSESEALIQRALAAALEHRTAIVIAHRLSTIVDADEILVVDEGRIVERGTHAELVVAGGTYAELYETQFSKATA
ncbi:MAG: ABC transporter ATP-binding protein [Actinomycetota bacterium]